MALTRRRLQCHSPASGACRQPTRQAAPPVRKGDLQQSRCAPAALREHHLEIP